MGEILPQVYLTGTKYDDKRQMLMLMSETKPYGKVIKSQNKKAESKANW